MTKLIRNKETDKFTDGQYIFGFEIKDLDGVPFWDTDYISWRIVTNKSVWDQTSQNYVNSTTEYFLANCQDYYEESLSDVIILDKSEYVRAGLNKYQCPRELLPKFIEGT